MVTADGHSWWWQLMINWQNNVPGHDNALPHHLPPPSPLSPPPSLLSFPLQSHSSCMHHICCIREPITVLDESAQEVLTRLPLPHHHVTPKVTVQIHLFNWQSNCSQRQCICTSLEVILFIMISVYIIIYNILFLYSNYSVTIESLLYMYACKCSHH